MKNKESWPVRQSYSGRARPKVVLAGRQATPQNSGGQALIISVWVLLMLTVVVISVGHRVSFSLRLGAYQRDRLKASYLAKAGVTRAIRELGNDTNSHDALNENWADDALDGESIFENITFGNANEFAAVNYTATGADNETINIYGVIDEERKININTASGDLLTALFTSVNLTSPQDLANNTLIWRGNDTDDIYNKTLGYACKGGNFTNPEELKLVKDINESGYESMKGLITVYGDGKININTAPAEILTVFYRSGTDAGNYSYADNLVNETVAYRNPDGLWGSPDDKIFANQTDINDFLTNANITDLTEQNIFNTTKGNFSMGSNYFRIESAGNAGKIKSRISVVYNRLDNQTLYWHER